jgi:uncharacterized membrane protein
MTDKHDTASRMADARRRFWRLMKLMFGVTSLVLAVAFTWLHQTGTPLPLHFIIAISIAVVGSLMLAAALMGLVFFSNASGADDGPEDPFER